MKVLGIDPGSRVTGWGVVDQQGSRAHRLASGCVRLPTDQPLLDRLPPLAAAVGGLLDSYEPDLVAVESLFHGVNPRSAIVLAHARGAILCEVGRRGHRVLELAPAEVKRAVTGNGRAEKEQVQRMVRMLLGLQAKLAADAADALAVALCAAQVARHPTADPALTAPPARRQANRRRPSAASAQPGELAAPKLGRRIRRES